MLCRAAVFVLLAGTALAQVGPIVIAHRGASGYLPEHTLEAYALAHGLGADYIEADLVMTKDHQLIALHDLYLEPTTDVEQKHPDRKHDDGHWYAADFTLEEIKQLRVHERLSGRFPVGTSKFEVPTFAEMIELVQGLNVSRHKDVGIYPELKQPQWHRDHQLPLEEKALETLVLYGYSGPEARCFIQCFEPDALKRLRNDLKCTLPMIQLLSTQSIQAPMLTDAGLDEIKRYAQGIGPDKRLIEADPKLVQRAHDRSLLVHPYTFREDDLPKAYSSFEEEVKRFIGTCQVDGLFTDHCGTVSSMIVR